MATPEYVFLDGKILPYAEAKVGVMTDGIKLRNRDLRRHPRILE